MPHINSVQATGQRHRLVYANSGPAVKRLAEAVNNIPDGGGDYESEIVGVSFTQRKNLEEAALYSNVSVARKHRVQKVSLP